MEETGSNINNFEDENYEGKFTNNNNYEEENQEANDMTKGEISKGKYLVK
jgi:hypothetical protein